MVSVPLPGLEDRLSENVVEILATRDKRNYEAQFNDGGYTNLGLAPAKKYIIRPSHRFPSPSLPQAQH